MSLIIHLDGAARGNPGPAGAGLVIEHEDGRLIHAGSYFLGSLTGDAAGYHALLFALHRVRALPPEPLRLCADLEPLVRQLTGQHDVRDPELAELHAQVQLLLLKVGCWNVQQVKHERNRRADELARLATERQCDAVIHDQDGLSARPAGTSAPAPIDALPAAPLPEPPAPADPAPLPAAEPHPAGLRLLITVVAQPSGGVCPAGALPATIPVGDTLPGGLCLHAAHALLPTLVALSRVEPHELATVPALSLRCARPGCGAAFLVAPKPSQNGAPHTS